MSQDLGDAGQSLEFGCPVCRMPLHAERNLLHCGSCAGEWPVVNGIPRFSDQSFYWGEIPRTEMTRCLRLAEVSGWRTAIEEVCGQVNPGLVQYITDSRRVNWFYALDDDVASVLDLGAGWGTITANLAPHVGSVVALEAVTERIEFVALRCRQESLTNVHPLQSDFHNVPFGPSSFDLIVANGVLEWVGLADETTDPKELQSRFLEQMWGLLRPGGCLYIGIENRLAYSNFLGARDHSGLPFTALLPRTVASMATRGLRRTGLGSGYRTEAGQSGYRTYTYSLKGYADLLRAAGFDSVEAYAPLPSYNDPRFLIPLDTPNASAVWQHFVGRWAQPRTGRQRIMLGAVALGARFKLSKALETFVPAFSLFAHRAR